MSGDRWRGTDAMSPGREKVAERNAMLLLPDCSIPQCGPFYTTFKDFYSLPFGCFIIALSLPRQIGDFVFT